MQKIKNLPNALYITAMIIIFTSVFIFNIIDYKINDREKTYLLIIVENIITIGLIISLIIKVKLKEDKNKIYFNMVFLIGFIYIIFQSLSDLIPSLKKIVEFVGFILAILFYLAIIFSILRIIYIRFFKKNTNKNSE